MTPKINANNSSTSRLSTSLALIDLTLFADMSLLALVDLPLFDSDGSVGARDKVGALEGDLEGADCFKGEIGEMLSDVHIR